MSNPQYTAYLSMFEQNSAETNLVFLGDSLTARGRFEEFYAGLSLLNRGIGSDTSEGVLHRLEEVERRHPKKIFLMIGINDLAQKKKIEEITVHVESILEELISRLPECRVYLQSVLPAKNVSSGLIESLNSRYRKIAESFDRCEYVDLYPAFLTEGGERNSDLYSADGVHLNGAGYKTWTGRIDRYVLIR